MKVVEIRYLDMDKAGGLDSESGENVNLWANWDDATKIESHMEEGKKVFVVVDKYTSQPDGRKFAWISKVLDPHSPDGLEDKRKAIRRQIVKTASAINTAEMRGDFGKVSKLQKKFNRLARLNEETVRYQKALGGV
jgi:hypothetical protein